MTWKSYIAMSGAGLLATYMASAPPGVAPQRNAAQQSASVPASAPVLDVQLQALRLEPKSAPGKDAVASRDPFRFAERTTRASRAPREEPPPAPVLEPAAPEPPPIRLSGITTRMVDGNQHRTAILITPQGVVEAREGDSVVSDFSVTRIQDNAVELTGPEGVIRRLLLRP